ncbi:YjeJ family protein [Klebsiella pneumoniae]|uniref:YjeJ family protein n=1 Tax=Klebsiella pneumoniae TaxID=573 RepID=UPI003A4DABEB|nr:YjeJ family protein [Klebsiella pneumoniae]MCP6388676.1 YjeJ family protein [Klebsiella pneumoniae]HBX8161788.1 hypothetical protein [Klebsiella pneumoniae]
MQGTFIGFNTAGIMYEDSFLALMLKIKQHNQACQVFYLQAPILVDLLLILYTRMAIIAKNLNEDENYKSGLIAFNEEFIKNTPIVEESEIQEPAPERRIVSITLKPGDTYSILILVLQNAQITSLRIDDKQVEAMLIGIHQALKNSGDHKLIEYLSSNLDFLMLYALDLRKDKGVDYQQSLQEDWKLNLFSHYLGVLYCCETDEGKKIVSGAVVKTSAPHLSELENNVVTRLIEKSPKLKAMHAELAPCQIFSTIIPSQPGRMLSLEECLRPLHAFYLEKKAELSA